MTDTAAAPVAVTEQQTFQVHIVEGVSTTVEVQAASVDEVLETYAQAPGMPGSITHGAFGSSSVDEAGDWEAYTVYDSAGNVAWERDNAKPSEVAAMREEIARLKAYAETTQHHQQQHAEAFRELTKLREQRDAALALIDGYDGAGEIVLLAKVSTALKGGAR